MEQDNVPHLSAERLNQMIETALSYHQEVKRPSLIPANMTWRAPVGFMAIAASLILLIAVISDLSPVQPSGTITVSVEDTYDDLTDLMVLETFGFI